MKFVIDLSVQYVGNEIGRPSLDLVGLPFLAGQQRGGLGFGGDNPDVGSRGLDDLAGTRHCAARAIASDPVVEPATCKVTQDLGPGRMAVILRIGRVLELSSEKPPVLFGKLLCPLDHTRAAFRRRRQNNFRPKATHDLAALDRKRIRHGGDERVALRRANHGKRDARVTRGGFDDGLAGLQRASAFGVVDDGKGQSVFHGGHRIE